MLGLNNGRRVRHTLVIGTVLVPFTGIGVVAVLLLARMDPWMSLFLGLAVAAVLSLVSTVAQALKGWRPDGATLAQANVSIAAVGVIAILASDAFPGVLYVVVLVGAFVSLLAINGMRLYRRVADQMRGE